MDEAKVRAYLLAAEHPVGRFKAAFFRTLGYTPAHWLHLQQSLVAHARTADAVPESASAYGQKFRIRATLQRPAGRPATLVSVWIFRVEDVLPRFVTAFPGDSR